MKTNIDQVRTVINKHSNFLKDNYHVKKIGVFGSVARGDQKEISDIDILVEFSEPIGFFRFIELEEFLSNAIGKKVDLVTQKALKPVIKEDILKEVVYV